jgi:hypothetical protein
MTIKDRFRIALFNFFKPEIMSVVNQDISKHLKAFPMPSLDYPIDLKNVPSSVRIEEFRAEIILDQLSDREFMSKHHHQRIPFEFYYQEKIEQMKKNIASKVADMIDIDSKELVQDYCYSPRKVYFSIFVGKKQ